MSVVGTPHVGVLEPTDEDDQATGVHAHASNEELIFNLKQEEGRVAVGAKPV